MKEGFYCVSVGCRAEEMAGGRTRRAAGHKVLGCKIKRMGR